MWVAPEETGLEPGYAEADVTAALATGDLVVVVSGLSRHATTTPVTINNSTAALHVAQMPAGRTVTLPASPYGHLYVARGEVELAVDDRLLEGDAVRTRKPARSSCTAPAEPRSCSGRCTPASPEAQPSCGITFDATSSR